jgi:hypothetical protein
VTRGQRLLHRRAWLGLALLLPAILALAFALKVQHRLALGTAALGKAHAP